MNVDRATLREIKLLLLDVDGVLTDGSIHFDAEGRETKTFHVHDGAGLTYWHRAGFWSGFVSGRKATVVEQRAKELGVHEVHLGSLDKIAILEEILARRGLPAQQVAYVGDDLVDLPVLARVGFAVSVPNARSEVRARAHHVTAVGGGAGAVREVVELLLREKGLWQRLVDRGGVP